MVLKRTFDILGALMVLIIASPVMLVCALAVKLDTPGLVLYRQTRVGKDGREFRIFKFRSMFANADRTGGYSTVRGDARITRTGAVLRKTSLDESPQVFNVLLGDMSLVGPRPDVPAQRDGYTTKEWRLRHSIRPGITGLAQAIKRSDATPEERKALDLYYVKNQSIFFDLWIMIKTITQAFRKGGY